MAPPPQSAVDLGPDWVVAENLVRRADWAFAMAGMPNAPDPMAILPPLEPLLSADTIKGVRGAGSRQEALALLLASPEFMRR